jgi:hypothetical protein
VQFVSQWCLLNCLQGEPTSIICAASSRMMCVK